MSLFFQGNNISDIYVGTDKIDSIWVGNDLVYTSFVDTSYYFNFYPNDLTQTCTVKLYQYMSEGADWSKFVDPVPTAPSFQYSYNGKTWQPYTLGTTLSIGGNNPGKVYFKGDNLSGTYSTYLDTDTYVNHYTYLHCVLTGDIKADGNIMSLRYSNPSDLNNTIIPCSYAFYKFFSGCNSLMALPELPATTLETYCYASMFDNCTSLTTSPSLPATTLAERCYGNMFEGCSSLTTPPSLSATTLANGCYYQMFKSCTSLTTSPSLPATTLKAYCYGSMFDGCTSLTTPPSLPATTLILNCYGAMFKDCTSLTTPPTLSATTLAETCYMGMFENCTSLTTPPSLPATTLVKSCYYQMFKGCTSLTRIPKLNATTIPDGGLFGTYASMYEGSNVRGNKTSSGVCNKAYRIPTSGTGTAGSKDFQNMFTALSGSGSFTPSINTTFYINVPSF